MRLSIIMPRRNRPFANECELRSLVCQHFPKDEYELIVLDDSDRSDTPRVFRSFDGDLNIRFVHLHGWDRVLAGHHVGPRGRKSLAPHLNYGIQRSRGDLIWISLGEMVHLGETLYEMTAPHDAHPSLLLHAGAQDITEDGLRSHDWADHPHALLRRSDIWGTIACPPMSIDIEGMIGATLRASHVRRVGGFDEQYARDTIGCEDEELARRLRRSGLDVRSTARIVLGHVAHPASSGLPEFVSDVTNYRALRRARLRKDAGYWHEADRVRYYRPGTERVPIRANRDGTWGQLPAELELWSLEETISRLEDSHAG